jgi:6-phosphogluconolactonase (cycloisomerase 2 family)
MLKCFRSALAVLCVAALAACGGASSPTETHTIGVSVSGLLGSGLKLSDNGSDTLAVTADGSVTFAQAVAKGSPYSVSVAAQPSSPWQTCTVTNGSGTVQSANVTSVSVTCVTNSYSIQATVSGLSGSGLVIQDNWGDNLAVSGSGTATFVTQVPSGSSYGISVLTQPSNPVQNCTVANGSGIVGGATVTTPAITCVTQSPWILVTVDYGGNTLSLFNIDPATGQPRARGRYRVGSAPTDINGDGQGRFLYVLNSGDGSISGFSYELSSSSLVPMQGPGQAAATFPAGAGSSSLTGYPGSKTLYVTHKGSNVIAAYAINQTTGALTEISGSPFNAGTSPQKLTLDATGRYAYVTNAGSNDVYAYTIDATTGALAQIANGHVATDSQPFELLLHRTGRFAYVANTGSASISAYSVSSATGALTPLPGSPFSTGGVPGDVTPYNGGRAPMVLHPNGKLLLVRSTSAQTISVFTIDQGSGALSPAPGGTVMVGQGAVWQSLDPTGRFLFVANHGLTPGPGSISVFSLDQSSGALTPVAGSPFPLSGGPDMISWDPSGKFLYAASDATDFVYAMAIDQTTGALTPLNSGAAVLTGEFPVVALAIPGVAQPGTAAFSSKYAYVSNSDNSISAFAIDAATGKLTAVPGTPVQTNGSALAATAVSADGKVVYALNATTSNVSLFDIDPSSGAMTVRNSLWGFGAGCTPNLFTLDAAAQNLYVVCPGTVSMTAYPIDPLTQGLDAGGGVNFAPGPVPTAFAVDLPGRFAYGLRGGALESYLTPPGSVSTPGLNPPAVAASASSVAVHPSGRFVYVANAATAGSIQSFTVATVNSSGVFAGTLSAGGSTTTGSAPLAIAIEPTGHFLYTADGGSNTLTGFAVNQGSGALAPLATGPFPIGTHPISVAADYSGKYLLVVSDTSKAVLTFAIDPTTGALAQVGTPATTGPSPKGIAVSTDIKVQ